MAFDSIKDILSKIRAKNPSLEKRLEEALAVETWDKAVGPAIAKHARALKVDQGTLWVEVDHSVWKTELHHRKRQILEKLNEATGGKDPIRDLFLIEPKRTFSSGGTAAAKKRF